MIKDSEIYVENVVGIVSAMMRIAVTCAVIFLGGSYIAEINVLTQKQRDLATAIQAVESGQADAVMSATPTLQAAIDKGRPMTLLGDPLYYEPLSVAFDKSSELDQTSLAQEVSTIIEEMHADGTLSELSMEWYGEDLTVSTEG